MTPDEIRASMKRDIDMLMSEESCTFMLTTNKKDGLVLNTAAIGMEPDYRELGRNLYRLLEANEQYGEAFALVLQGLDDMVQRDDVNNLVMKVMERGSGTAS